MALYGYARLVREYQEEKGIEPGVNAVKSECIARGEARGKIAMARAIVLRLGTLRFGVPDLATSVALNLVDSAEELEELADRILIAGSWNELLAK